MTLYWCHYAADISHCLHICSNSYACTHHYYTSWLCQDSCPMWPVKLQKLHIHHHHHHHHHQITSTGLLSRWLSYSTCLAIKYCTWCIRWASYSGWHSWLDWLNCRASCCCVLACSRHWYISVCHAATVSQHLLASSTTAFSTIQSLSVTFRASLTMFTAVSGRITTISLTQIQLTFLLKRQCFHEFVVLSEKPVTSVFVQIGESKQE